MKIYSSRNNNHRQPVTAAADDDFMDNDEGLDNFEDTFDDLADTVDDMQEHIDGIEEDDVDIEIDNNIANHYIVQCDSCQDVFISALTESDQEVTKISGICPCCDKETDQYVKWVVKEV